LFSETSIDPRFLEHLGSQLFVVFLLLALSFRQHPLDYNDTGFAERFNLKQLVSDSSENHLDMDSSGSTIT
jgi:hypothetical protein